MSKDWRRDQIQETWTQEEWDTMCANAEAGNPDAETIEWNLFYNTLYSKNDPDVKKWNYDYNHPQPAPGILLPIVVGNKFIDIHFDTTKAPIFSDFYNMPVEHPDISGEKYGLGPSWYWYNDSTTTSYNKGGLIIAFIPAGTYIPEFDFTIQKEFLAFSDSDCGIPMYITEGALEFYAKLAQVYPTLEIPPYLDINKVKPGWQGSTLREVAQNVLGLIGDDPDFISIKDYCERLIAADSCGIIVESAVADPVDIYDYPWNGNIAGFVDTDYYKPAPLQPASSFIVGAEFLDTDRLRFDTTKAEELTNYLEENISSGMLDFIRLDSRSLMYAIKLSLDTGDVIVLTVQGEVVFATKAGHVQNYSWTKGFQRLNINGEIPVSYGRDLLIEEVNDSTENPVWNGIIIKHVQTKNQLVITGVAKQDATYSGDRLQFDTNADMVKLLSSFDYSSITPGVGKTLLGGVGDVDHSQNTFRLVATPLDAFDQSLTGQYALIIQNHIENYSVYSTLTEDFTVGSLQIKAGWNTDLLVEGAYILTTDDEVLINAIYEGRWPGNPVVNYIKE